MDKEQFANLLKEMLAGINGDNTGKSNERHVQGGTQLSLPYAEEEQKTYNVTKRKKRRVSKYKQLGENKARIHNGVGCDSAHKRYRLTLNAVVSKLIIGKEMPFFSISADFTTGNVCLLFSEEDIWSNGMSYNTSTNVMIDSKQLVSKMLGALNVHRKKKVLDLSISWEGGTFASGKHFLLVTLESDEGTDGQ